MRTLRRGEQARMKYYARVVFETNASVAERHDDEMAARRWIEDERNARPGSFRIGEIFEATPHYDLVATIDRDGWKSS